MKKIEIIPAILPKDFAELEEKIGLIKGFAKTVQVDICDGQFTASPSWPYKKRDDSFEKIVHQSEGLPGWEDLEYEFDLMTNKPEKVVKKWVQAGASRIIIHAEANGNIAAAIVELSGAVEVGLALNIGTSLDLLELHQNRIQFVQCMGIDNIGFQAQAFDEKVIEKIKMIRAKFPGLPISVDGGVSLKTAPRLIEAGADRLVVGSAIFDTENPIDSLQKFNRL